MKLYIARVWGLGAGLKSGLNLSDIVKSGKFNVIVFTII
jgi:hypothetical protein